MWIMAKTWAEKLVEIAVLKEQVGALRATIAGLLKVVDKLEEAAALERARSDRAVDKMLGQQGIPPVTPNPMPTLDQLSSLFEEDPAVVREIQDDIKEHGAANVLLGTN